MNIIDLSMRHIKLNFDEVSTTTTRNMQRNEKFTWVSCWVPLPTLLLVLYISIEFSNCWRERLLREDDILVKERGGDGGRVQVGELKIDQYRPIVYRLCGAAPIFRKMVWDCVISIRVGRVCSEKRNVTVLRE